MRVPERIIEIADAMERAADLDERDPDRPVTCFDARGWAEALREAATTRGAVDPSALALATEAIVAQHEEEMQAYLRGEVEANAWRPEKYAEAVLLAIAEAVSAEEHERVERDLDHEARSHQETHERWIAERARAEAAEQERDRLREALDYELRHGGGTADSKARIREALRP